MEHGSGRERVVGFAPNMPDVSDLKGLDLVHALRAALKRGEDLQHYDLSHIPEPIEDEHDSDDNPLCGDCLYPGCQGCDK